MEKLLKCFGTVIKIDRAKLDKIYSTQIHIWIADNECIDTFFKKVMEDNNIIYDNGIFIKTKKRGFKNEKNDS